MSRHIFNFLGGEELTTMGTSWFISYKYFLDIDKNHNNWKKVKTYITRQLVYDRTTNLHEYWLNKVISMEVDNLNKNKICLDGNLVKEMAKKLLKNN